MLSLTIELVTWGLYFGVGILLLVLLIFARRCYQKIEARKRKSEKIMQQHYLGKEVPDVWKSTGYR